MFILLTSSNALPFASQSYRDDAIQSNFVAKCVGCVVGYDICGSFMNPVGAIHVRYLYTASHIHKFCSYLVRIGRLMRHANEERRKNAVCNFELKK